MPHRSRKKAGIPPKEPAPIDWEDARLLLAVAETGSLTKAALALRVAQPTVSRRIASLEARLGEALIERAAEGGRVTAFGETLVEPAKRMAEWAAELQRAAERRSTEPRGVVRITAPPGVAFELLAPFAGELKQSLPDIRLEVLSTVQTLDLSRREADLALRAQRPSQRDLVVVASVDLEAAPFVSRAYAKKHPKRARIEDVDFIAWAPPLDHLAPNPQLAKLIPGFRPSFASDDFVVQMQAARAGLGAIFLSRVDHRFNGHDDLVEIDVGLPPIPAGLYLVAARGSLSIPRVRVVADRLAAELKAIEPRGRVRGR